MDIAKYLATRPSSSSSSSSSGSEMLEPEPSKFGGGSCDEVDGRQRADGFKRRGINFTGTQSDNRTILAVKANDRRKSSRTNRQNARRGVGGDDTVREEMAEKEANKPSRAGAQHKNEISCNATKEKTQSRREKLQEYLETKKKLEEARKKQAKPAFKAGAVHYPLAPFGVGAHKPNDFHGNLSRVSGPRTGNLSTMSSMSSNTTNQANRTKPQVADKSQASNSTRAVRASTRAAAVAATRASRTATRATAKTKAAAPPKIQVTPCVDGPLTSSSSQGSVSSIGSVSSNCSTKSFAPEEFTFSMNMAAMGSQEKGIKAISTPVSNKRRSVIPAPTVPLIPKENTGYFALKSNSILEDEKRTKMGKEKEDEDEDEYDEVFGSEKKTAILPWSGKQLLKRSARNNSTKNSSQAPSSSDLSSNVDLLEVDQEIFEAVYKNSTAKKLTRASEASLEETTGVKNEDRGTTKLKPILPTDDFMSPSLCRVESFRGGPTPAALQGEKNLPVEEEKKIPSEGGKEQPGEDVQIPARGRSRTRRISGIQPDHTISPDSLARTPAQRVKRRSLSSNRRSALSECVACEGHDGHPHGKEEKGEMDRNRGAFTGQTPKVSRKSTLPMLSETSPSQESTEEVGVIESRPTTRRRTRGSMAKALSSVVDTSDEDESSSNRKEKREDRRRSSRRSRSSATMDQGEVETPSGKQVRARGRRSRAVKEMEDEEEGMSEYKTAEEGDSHPHLQMAASSGSSRRNSKRSAGGQRVEDLTDTMESATINSVPRAGTISKTTGISSPPQVEAMDMNVSEFKTPSLPMRSVRKAQSASKVRISPLVVGSPWINVGRRSSATKRKGSMSEGKPPKSDISSLFDDIPEDKNSPIHALLAKRVKSADNLEDLEDLSFGRLPKAKELNMEFEEIARSEKMPLENEPALPAAAIDEAATAVVAKAAKAVEGQEESEHDVPYFRNLLASESARITSLCNMWEEKINTNIPEPIQGQIRSVVGQGRLVMAERFKQFSGLVDNCEFGTGERTTSCMDLQGFWEMIYFQVEDVDKKFDELVKVEENGWQEVEVVVVVAKSKKKLVPGKKRPADTKPVVKAVASSGLRAAILARKKAAALSATAGSESSSPLPPAISVSGPEPEQREGEPAHQNQRPNIKELIAAKRAQLAAKKNAVAAAEPEVDLLTPSTNTEAEKSFEGGFFSIKSPVRSSPHSKESSPARVSGGSLIGTSKSTGADKLRRAVLTESARRLSGMVSPYISQMSKRSLSQEISPMKGTRRSALFPDDEEPEMTHMDSTSPATSTEMIDPVAPLSSPVTRTYSKQGGSPALEQSRRDAFDQLMMSPCTRSSKVQDEVNQLDVSLPESPANQPAGLDPRYLVATTPPPSQDWAVTPFSERFASSSEEDGQEEFKENTSSDGIVKPVLKSVGPERRRTRQSVKFTPDVNIVSEEGSMSAAGTPHPLTGRRSRIKVLDEIDSTTASSSNANSPLLRRSRVSLLPGMEDKQSGEKTEETLAVPVGNLISLDSPSVEEMEIDAVPSTPSRRSLRMRD